MSRPRLVGVTICDRGGDPLFREQRCWGWRPALRLARYWRRRGNCVVRMRLVNA